MRAEGLWLETPDRAAPPQVVDRFAVSRLRQRTKVSSERELKQLNYTDQARPALSGCISSSSPSFRSLDQP